MRVETPERFKICENNQHWTDILVWGYCGTCKVGTPPTFKRKVMPDRLLDNEIEQELLTK